MWPFPQKAFDRFNGTVKGYLAVEMNAMGQMVEDVVRVVKDILAGKKEVF